jgi:hypothetical protein
MQPAVTSRPAANIDIKRRAKSSKSQELSTHNNKHYHANSDACTCRYMLILEPPLPELRTTRLHLSNR